MDQQPDDGSSVRDNCSTEASTSTKQPKKRQRKMKSPVKIREEVMALPGECRLQQVKSEMLSETDTLEASSNNPSSGRAKVGKRKKKQKIRKDSTGSELQPKKGKPGRKRKQVPDEQDKKSGKGRRKRIEIGAGLDFLQKMKRSPEKRKRQEVQIPVNVTSKSIREQRSSERGRAKWYKTEKLQLLGAIEKYGAEDWKNILKSVPSKSQKQIENFYRTLKAKHSGRKTPSSVASKAPIEYWLQAAETTTMFNFDYSSLLPKIMSMAGYLEPHDTPRLKVSTDPDWTRVHQYLASLMTEEETANPQMLSNIEAAVLLDLLQNLSDHLNSLNTSKQRELMQKKYEQLLSNAVMLRKHGEEQAIYHGLDKDPLVDTIPQYVPARAGSSASSTMADNQQTSTANKSKLYSINPFSIPVKYLRPNPKQ